mmetsp:Transcript_31431/g.80236  ORF Transcript_31431/g.80236 Transcript_31431/m.80236 type:complete len:205 (-) Transcript_31431:56-670(-)
MGAMPCSLAAAPAYWEGVQAGDFAAAAAAATTEARRAEEGVGAAERVSGLGWRGGSGVVAAGGESVVAAREVTLLLPPSHQERSVAGELGAVVSASAGAGSPSLGAEDAMGAGRLALAGCLAAAAAAAGSAGAPNVNWMTAVHQATMSTTSMVAASSMADAATRAIETPNIRYPYVRRHGRVASPPTRPSIRASSTEAEQMPGS